jgi:ubiquinone/menaquinone biosynthesis C-methylase UbiE
MSRQASTSPTEAAAFEFSGEQVVEGGTPDRVWQDHQARYQFASPLAVGRRVVDAACGTGYGSFMLAQAGASSVVGVDISERALAFARQKYQRDNLSYFMADVTRLALPDGAADMVTSFETIEHVDDAEAALRELTRVLAPRGTLLISSPNRTVTSPTKGKGDAPDNRFHRVEYIASEFDELLAPNYRVLARYGQRSVPGILYRPSVLRVSRRLSGIKLAAYGYAPKHGSPTLAPLVAGWEPRYLVYLCQKR